MPHPRRVYVRRSRLRVGLGRGVAQLSGGSGHGVVWRHVLDGLRRSGRVKLVHGGRADVWLASGHETRPDGSPLVVQVHEAGWTDPGLRALLDPEFVAAMSATTQASVAAADHVIVPSGAAERQVREAYGLHAANVHVIHHGVNQRLFRPGVAGGREQVGGPYVLFVGVLHPRKNLAAVRAAVAELARRGHPQVLVVVGNPAPDRRAAQFETEARLPIAGRPDRVVHLRHLSPARLAAVMAGADVFCLPSLFEGFGLPALEALASGVPAVVADRGALPELVGDAALVVAPDEVSVSAAVGRVIEDPALAARLRRAGPERAAEFSWERTVAGWLKVLELAAAGG